MSATPGEQEKFPEKLTVPRYQPSEHELALFPSSGDTANSLAVRKGK